MGLKSEFKPICKKIWKAFNSWRKRGMWFRVTVLLIIAFSMNVERLLTTDHVPLINEWVWIACRAIRSASEPKVTSAYLRYFHVQKSRQLQKQLREKVKDGSLHLKPNKMKLLSQNTHDANYNKLFKLAQRAKLISANLTLSQSKRAMLDKACKFTAERYDPEYADIKKIIYTMPPLDIKQLQLNFLRLWRNIFVVFPLPIIPALPWFILCFTLGMCGASLKSQAKFSLFAALAVVMTFVWLYFSAYANGNWEGWRWVYQWRLLGISVFLAVWAIIGSILGRRLYKYASKYSKENQVFIFSLLTSGIILLMAGTCFKTYHAGVYPWWVRLSGYYLLFRSFAFAPYFVTIGIGVLCYTWFLIHKNYAEQLKKFKWLAIIKYGLVIFFILELLYSWNLLD
jgi:hypothetical protein